MAHVSRVACKVTSRSFVVFLDRTRKTGDGVRTVRLTHTIQSFAGRVREVTMVKIVKNVENHGEGDANSQSHSFVFRVWLHGSKTGSCAVVNKLLMDCGATTHTINDDSKFIDFDKQFDPEKRFIELADCNRTNDLV